MASDMAANVVMTQQKKIEKCLTNGPTCHPNTLLHPLSPLPLRSKAIIPLPPFRTAGWLLPPQPYHRRRACGVALRRWHALTGCGRRRWQRCFTARSEGGQLRSAHASILAATSLCWILNKFTVFVWQQKTIPSWTNKQIWQATNGCINVMNHLQWYTHLGILSCGRLTWTRSHTTGRTRCLWDMWEDESGVSRCGRHGCRCCTAVAPPQHRRICKPRIGSRRHQLRPSCVVTHVQRLSSVASPICSVHVCRVRQWGIVLWCCSAWPEDGKRGNKSWGRRGV